MPLADGQILRLNPWWTNPSWQRGDPHLAALNQATAVLAEPGFVQRVALDRPAVHTVRGPRQVGKSTGLKQLVVRALREPQRNPRSVIYLALDFLGDQPIAELAATIQRARELAANDGAVVLLLDEVTAVTRWAEAIKALWDDGTLRRDVVVCTGSSAIELAASSVERLPGRRGGGRDFLVLPQSFSGFARAIAPELPESPALSPGQVLEPAATEILRRSLAHLPQLDAVLESYLTFGGLPAAVAEASTGAAAPSPEVMRILWDSLEREVAGPGASRAALVALLERVARSLGSKTSWSAVAREMDVPLGGRHTKGDYRTVKQYVEHLSRSYFLLVLYFWKAGSDSKDLSRDKKIYFGDPLLHTIALEKAPGLKRDVPAAVENAIALALYRHYEPTDAQAEGYAGPERLHAWETTRPNEIDFVCGPRAAIEMVEVKFRSHIGLADTLAMRRSFPGRPHLLVTRDVLRLEGEHAWIPASLLLWALG